MGTVSNFISSHIKDLFDKNMTSICTVSISKTGRHFHESSDQWEILQRGKPKDVIEIFIECPSVFSRLQKKNERHSVSMFGNTFSLIK